MIKKILCLLVIITVISSCIETLEQAKEGMRKSRPDHQLIFLKSLNDDKCGAALHDGVYCVLYYDGKTGKCQLSRFDTNYGTDGSILRELKIAKLPWHACEYTRSQF